MSENNNVFQEVKCPNDEKIKNKTSNERLSPQQLAQPSPTVPYNSNSNNKYETNEYRRASKRKRTE